MTTNGFAHTINSWRAGLASPTPNAQYGELINNLTSLRRGIFDLAGDSRRNLDFDCGWPNSGALTPEVYREIFDRNAIANRVISLFPKECFQVTPEVYEKSKGSTETPFEKSWTELCKSVAGSSWHGGDKGTVVWERLKRLDILSGVGTFGIMLIGLDDGMRLDEPAVGVVDKVHEGIAFNSDNYLVDSPMSEAEEKKYADMKLSDVEKRSIAKWKWQRGQIRNAAAKVAVVQNAAFDDGSDNPRSPKNMLGRYDGEAPSESQQWFGTQFGAPEQSSTIPSKVKRKVTFLRVFDESSVQVTRWEANVNSPRFGQPVMYRVTFNDPRDQSTGSTSMPSTTAFVHWSRVIHVADNKMLGEALGTPRTKPVYNDIVDIRKVKGSGAEGYYKSCFPILAFETHPQLGGDVDIDQDKLRQNVEQLINSLQRVVLGIGGSWKTLPPSVVDPTPHINAGIEAICIQLGCPVRIFKGAERGELASSQDDAAWNDRIRERQNGHVTPVIIVPFIDRLIQMGVLEPPQAEAEVPALNRRRKWTYNAETGAVEKAPQEPMPGEPAPVEEEETETKDEPGYKIEWPDLDSLSDSDRASIASSLTQALGAYVSSGAADIMPLFEYLTVVWQMDDEEATMIVEAMEKHQEEVTAEQQAMAEEQGFQPEAPEGMIDPEQRDMDQEVALEKAKNGGGGGFPPKKGGPPVANVFCPTGEGGGVDPSCGGEGGGSGDAQLKITRNDEWKWHAELDNGFKFDANFSKVRNGWSVNFSDEKGDMELTGKHGGKAVGIMRRVGLTLDKFIAAKQPKSFNFSADNSEPSRVSLYNKVSNFIAERHGYDRELTTGKYETIYTFRRKASVNNTQLQSFDLAFNAFCVAGDTDA